MSYRNLQGFKTKWEFEVAEMVMKNYNHKHNYEYKFKTYGY
jgi:hypothetical protein